MTTETPCGRIGLITIVEAAERAAGAVCSAREKKMAVCLDPMGFVTVGAIEHAILGDLVDAYDKGNQLALWRQIETDLATACKERGITGGRGHRHRVIGQRRAA